MGDFLFLNHIILYITGNSSTSSAGDCQCSPLIRPDQEICKNFTFRNFSLMQYVILILFVIFCVCSDSIIVYYKMRKIMYTAKV